MFLQIELLYFVLMIGGFIALLLFAKLPSGLCMMISALIGGVISAIVSKTPLGLRYFVEGTFGYFDTILVITTAMIFIGAMQATGALEYLSVVLVKTFRKYPSLLLIVFMIIIMFPGMVTGSSLASAIATGTLVAPIMIKWGIPKRRVGAIIGVGAILGMVAPPINVPAMVICDVVDIPFTGFTLPLLLVSLPIAIICVLLMGRKFVKPIAADEIESVVDTSVTRELNWTCTLPLILLVVFIVLEMIFPVIFGSLAMPAMFTLCTILGFFLGRKLKFYKKQSVVEVEEEVEEDGEIVIVKKVKENEQPESVVEVVRQGVAKSFGAMGLLMGVGMFMELITLNGVRGYFVTNAISLSDVWAYVGMGISLPLFGGISAFGSASMLGGPFVMALNGISDNIFATCGLSLLAAIGEFSPPTAMSANFAAEVVGEKKWAKISVEALPSLGIIFVYAMVYIILFGQLVQKALNKDALKLVLFAIMMAIAVAFAFVFGYIIRGKHSKQAVVAVEESTTEEAVVEEV